MTGSHEVRGSSPLSSTTNYKGSAPLVRPFSSFEHLIGTTHLSRKDWYVSKPHDLICANDVCLSRNC